MNTQDKIEMIERDIYNLQNKIQELETTIDRLDRNTSREIEALESRIYDLERKSR